jgi:hypothetical protein
MSGKTTLLLHLLADTGACLVANDRVAMRRPAGAGEAGTTALMRGMPTIVSVRESSLAHLPDLAARLEECGDHHRFSLAEGAGAGRAGGAGGAGRAGGGWSLTPAQLARLLGVSRSADVPLGAVLFPRMSLRPGGMTIAALPPDEAHRRLAALRFGPESPASDDLVGAVAASVPCLDCGIGTDAYTRGTGAKLLAAIFRQA